VRVEKDEMQVDKTGERVVKGREVFGWSASEW
jgi:hypothetical protein